MTNKPASTICFPAEWTPGCAVLMALPNPSTDWDYMLDEALDCFRRMVDAIAPYAPVVMLVPSAEYGKLQLKEQIARHGDRLTLIATEYNDTWTRDYGPLTVTDGPDGEPRLLDFTFNAWGLKFAADRDNRVNRSLASMRFYTNGPECRKDMVLEGGSVDTDGEGHLLTTTDCLLSANRNPAMTPEQIEQRLMDEFGVKKVLWLHHGYLAGDDTDSHIDTLARFAPSRQIVYTHCLDPDDEHYEALEAMRREIMELTDADGLPFNTVGIPLPSPVYDENGDRLPATYANFLVLPDAVIMPSYGQKRNDELAAHILEMVYERKVVSVDCLALVRQHGSLHCSTMQIPVSATVLS